MRHDHHQNHVHISTEQWCAASCRLFLSRCWWDVCKWGYFNWPCCGPPGVLQHLERLFVKKHKSYGRNILFLSAGVMTTWATIFSAERGFMSRSVGPLGFYTDWMMEPCCVCVCVCWLTLTLSCCCCFDLLDTRIALSVINLPHPCRTGGESLVSVSLCAVRNIHLKGSGHSNEVSLGLIACWLLWKRHTGI